MPLRHIPSGLWNLESHQPKADMMWQRNMEPASCSVWTARKLRKHGMPLELAIASHGTAADKSLCA